MPKIISPDNRFAWVQVDLGAIRRNIKRLASLTHQDTKMLCTLSANAFGHGIVEVAKASLSAGANMLAVSTLQEAIQLREAGIRAEILLLNEIPRTSIEALLTYGIIATTYSSEFALHLGEAAAARRLQAPFYLRLDVGTHDVGLWHEEAIEFLNFIDFHKGLKLKGIFTKLAGGDQENDWDYTVQFNRFMQTLQNIHDAGFEMGSVFCADDITAILHPESHLDMVNIQSSMYGFMPSQEVSRHITFEPAMSVHARAINISHPAIGEGVGDGLAYRVAKQAQIVTLPLGFADGIPTSLSNQIDVLFKGKRVSQVGSIQMNHLMVEVDSNIAKRNPVPPAELGDEFVLLGESKEDSIYIEEWAHKVHMKPLELSTLLGMRLPKVFVQGA
ncbi:MAG: alanine racemase [Coriobacteriia bacterium]|nr:alanine racemase [Coriobacteriia bacterium]